MKKIIGICVTLLFIVPCFAIEIREPLPEEIEDIAKVYFETWHHTYDQMAPYLSSVKTLENCIKLWRDLYNQKGKIVLLIAIDNHRIIGVSFAGPLTRSKDNFKEYDGEIDKVYVLPHYQNQGVGALLFQSTLSKLQDLGYQKIILQSLSKNNKANKFYERMNGNLVAILPVEFNETMHVYEFDLKTT